MAIVPPILAQQAASPSTLLPSLDTIFWATVLLIFLITILSAFLRRLAKDKALKLFSHYHVAFFSERRSALWGDLTVFSQGVELVFDQPYTTRRDIVKSSALLYDDEFTAMIAFTRSVHGLSEAEKKLRARQIKSTFKPNIFRRFKRWCRNLLNILRDAITKTMSLVIGRMTSAGGTGTAVASQAGDINSLTGSVIGLAANAYEPLLERYIGRPIVIEINIPPAPGAPVPPIPDTAEFPGYLVDYSQDFIAVFNVDHSPVEVIDIQITPGKPPDTVVTGIAFTITSEQTLLACTGKDAFILRRTCCHADTSDLGIALIPGTSLILPPINETTTITVERTRQIDIVVPRSRARVRFGAVPASTGGRRSDWLGIAPLLEPREFLHTLRHGIHTSRHPAREHHAPDIAEKPADTNIPKD